MKITEGMKVIESGWVKKPKGFRVKFQQLQDGELVTAYSPPEDATALDSDVTAWRYAWKLAQATRPDADTLAQGHLVNLTVVDDQDTPVISYITGETEIFNPHS